MEVGAKAVARERDVSNGTGQRWRGENVNVFVAGTIEPGL
jgi:hypothetical protein